MKLLRYGPLGREKPGLLDAGGQIRDLSAIIDDIAPTALSPERLAELAAVAPESLPVVDPNVRLGAPIAGVGKFLAIGLNFSDHAAESNLPIPDEPVIFTKATSSISGPYDDVVIPPGAEKVDWEVELGVVIGKTARRISEDAAAVHIAGFLVVNDISERAYQMERGGTWDKGKGCDTFGPIGPYLVTSDEVRNPQNLVMWLEVNGRRFQNGSSATMIFGVNHLVAYVSQFMTLLPGDIITTGTPPGVGLGQQPSPIYLRAGDVMRLGIEGLGEQQQTCVAACSAEIRA